MENERGITFVTLLVSLFILLVGVSIIVKIFPAISKLSERAKDSVSISLIADKIFTLLEEVYGNKDGQEIPDEILGIDNEFPQYFYKAEFKEERENFYRVFLEIRWEREGKNEKREFCSVIRRR